MIDKVSQILPGVLGQLQQQTKRKRYREDPVLWCREYLGLQLWSKQREILRSIKENRNTAVAAGHGVGKLLPLSTPIPTPSGWAVYGDLEVGDVILSNEGKPTTVVALSEYWDQLIYNITFDDGSVISAGENHEWDILDLSKRSRKDGTKGGVLDWRDYWHTSVRKTTQEMFDEGIRTTGNQLRWRIPVAQPIDLPDSNLPIDPYLLGFWLGDGDSDKAVITFGATKVGLIDYVIALGENFTLKDNMESRGSMRLGIPGVKADLIGLGVLNDKRIPVSYLRGSVAQRKALLAGLMDSDGFLMKTTGGADVGIDMTRKALLEDIQELVISLGGKVFYREDDAAYTLNGVRNYVGTRYRLTWTPLENPFVLRGQEWSEPTNQRSRHTQRTIVSIEASHREVSRCIEVDSPRHLYLAGKSMIPTHNSFIASIAMAWWVDVHPWNAQDTFVASTAPFQDQITTILWDNLRSIHSESHRRYAEGLIDHALPGYITSTNLWKLDSGETIGQGRKPPDGREDAGYQGKHATYLFAVGDEAAGLSSGMIDALGNISTGEFNRRLLIANPTDPNCAMAKLWDKPDAESTWNLMHISVLDSPMITKEEGFDLEKAGGMSGMDYVDQARQDWGEDDPRYIARVLGQWSFESGNTIYMETEIAKAVGAVVLPDPDGIPELGVDIARMGSDKSFVYKIEHGQVWETDPETSVPVKPTEKLGVRARLVDSWAKAPLTGDDPKNLGSAERIHKLALEMGVKIVKIDASGIGGGVIDGLATLNKAGNYVVVEIFGGAAASDKREYLNARAEGFFDLKTRFRGGLIDIDSGDDKLLDELRGMLYEHTDKGQIKVEAKDSMKRRGKSSPDRADALWYACFDARELVNPTTQPLQNGDRVMYDPYEFTGLSFEGAGLPV